MTDSKSMICGPDNCTPCEESTPTVAAESTGELLFFSDFICPWCLIGKSRLAKALSLVSDPNFTVRWMPFELNPSMPAEGMDRREYRSAKFGSWERSLMLDAHVERAARAEGLEIRHDLMERTPNTRNAHRLAWLAEQYHVQDQIAVAILRAYFLEGRDIGRCEVLADIAGEQGMKRDDTMSWLQSDAGVQETQQGLDKGRALGLSGVPAVVAKGEVLFSGAQDPRAIAVKLFGNRPGQEQ